MLVPMVTTCECEHAASEKAWPTLVWYMAHRPPRSSCILRLCVCRVDNNVSASTTISTKHRIGPSDLAPTYPGVFSADDHRREGHAPKHAPEALAQQPPPGPPPHLAQTARRVPWSTGV